jgi:hypothetical protein
MPKKAEEKKEEPPAPPPKRKAQRGGVTQVAKPAQEVGSAVYVLITVTHGSVMSTFDPGYVSSVAAYNNGNVLHYK